MSTLADVVDAINGLRRGVESMTTLVSHASAEQAKALEAQLEIAREQKRLAETAVRSISADQRAAAAWMSALQGSTVRSIKPPSNPV